MDFHSLNIDLCTILDALEDPIHIIDTDGILVFANLAWEKLIGLPRESAVGLYINDAISRGNQGFYFSIEKDEDSRAAQFTHFDQKLFDSIALSRPGKAEAGLHVRLLVLQKPVHADQHPAL